ncbi:hypothetical protein ACVWWJ_000400 [Luteibacter sp. HA06]
MDQEYKARQKRLGDLWFLIDIPLFIDAVGVGQLFDAMVRPEWRAIGRQRTEGKTDGADLTGKASVSGGADIPLFLKGEVKAALEGKLTNQTSESLAVNEESNRSPEMNLEKIVNYYVADFPERLLYVKGDLETLEDLDGKTYSWASVDDLLQEPGIRPLVVLDLPKGVKLMPMFAETVEGEDIALYKMLTEALGIKRTIPPPGDRTKPDYAEKQALHWDAYARAFDSEIAMEVVESARARLHWIDYRVCAEGVYGVSPIHINILARGEYANGTFAYKFVRRANQVGIRIIGTLKRDKDVNVLGIYER